MKNAELKLVICLALTLNGSVSFAQSQNDRPDDDLMRGTGAVKTVTYKYSPDNSDPGIEGTESLVINGAYFTLLRLEAKCKENEKYDPSNFSGDGASSELNLMLRNHEQDQRFSWCFRPDGDSSADWYWNSCTGAIFAKIEGCDSPNAPIRKSNPFEFGKATIGNCPAKSEGSRLSQYGCLFVKQRLEELDKESDLPKSSLKGKLHTGETKPNFGRFVTGTYSPGNLRSAPAIRATRNTNNEAIAGH